MINISFRKIHFFIKIGAKRPPALAGGGIAHPPLKDFA